MAIFNLIHKCCRWNISQTKAVRRNVRCEVVTLVLVEVKVSERYSVLTDK
jgi:hypothetical protein